MTETILTTSARSVVVLILPLRRSRALASAAAWGSSAFSARSDSSVLRVRPSSRAQAALPAVGFSLRSRGPGTL